MKKVILILGIIISIIGIASLFPYISDYSDLSNYGQGYVTGKILIAIIGVVLVVIGLRKPAHKKA